MNQKKVKLALLFCAVVGFSGLKAQDAPTAAGGDATGSGGSASYSAGQVVYTSNSSASGSVNQGVQQPYVVSTIGVSTNPDINLTMSVYPNPSTAFINLKVENQDLKNLSFQLFDVQGKILVNQKITATETTIKMEEYAQASYFLKVVDNKTELKTFKIIKN
jgi:Secretion system C-terminal sorting domain